MQYVCHKYTHNASTLVIAQCTCTMHSIQANLLIIRSSIRKYWGAFGKSVKSALADIPMGLSMLTEMVDSEPLNIL